MYVDWTYLFYDRDLCYELSNTAMFLRIPLKEGNILIDSTTIDFPRILLHVRGLEL